MSVSMKDGVQIKATIISKSGPPWEQQLLAEHKQKLLVSVPKGAPISTLKEKLEDKFTSSKLAELNRHADFLRSNGVSVITGAKITTLHTRDGYDIDEDSSLDELFGSCNDVVLEVQAEVDLIFTQAESELDCCGFC